MPRKHLSLAESIAKQKAYNQKRYQENKEYFKQKRSEQVQRERADCLLAQQGDKEAEARYHKLRDAGNVSRWKRGINLPKQERDAINAAISYVLGPERAALDNAKRRLAWQELTQAVEAGDADAAVKLAKYNKQNTDKQNRWLAIQRKNAAAGDAVAAHRLWKLTTPGREWVADQLAQGLGTELKDKIQATPSV